MVFPGAVDLQIAQRAALEAEAHLLGHAHRARVAGDDRRLDAVQARVLEGEAQHQPHGAGGVPAAERVLVDPVAERRVLPRAAHHVREGDAADEAVGEVGVEDGEGVGAPGRPRALVEVELQALAGLGVEALVARRVPRAGVLAIGLAQRELRGRVVRGGRPDRGRPVFEAHADGGHRKRASATRASAR